MSMDRSVKQVLAHARVRPPQQLQALRTYEPHVIRFLEYFLDSLDYSDAWEGTSWEWGPYDPFELYAALRMRIYGYNYLVNADLKARLGKLSGYAQQNTFWPAFPGIEDGCDDDFEKLVLGLENKYPTILLNVSADDDSNYDPRTVAMVPRADWERLYKRYERLENRSEASIDISCHVCEYSLAGEISTKPGSADFVAAMHRFEKLMVAKKLAVVQRSVTSGKAPRYLCLDCAEKPERRDLNHGSP